MTKSCEFCRFWQANGLFQQGECRLNGPSLGAPADASIYGHERPLAAWPITRSGDWCAQFLSRTPDQGEG